MKRWRTFKGCLGNRLHLFLCPPFLVSFLTVVVTLRAMVADSQDNGSAKETDGDEMRMTVTKATIY